MLFDAQLQVTQLEETIVDDHIQMSLLVSLAMPIGPTQVVPIPAGLLRFGLGKKAALEHGKQLIEYANQLPDPTPESDLIIAQNLSDVAKAAEHIEQISGKQ